MNESVNNSWKSTCKILLGDEIGDIAHYEKYLMKYVDEKKKVKSALSGKEVAISDSMHANASFISNDELEEYRKKTENIKLDVNNIKDFDSIQEQLQEIFYYSGNLIFGNSEDITSSSRCGNSFHVHESQDVYDSKYVVYSCLVRYGEYIFGSNAIGETQFGIKNFETYRDSRCMETIRNYTSSDCYYTGTLEGCNNCMFSFNLRNKSYRIGNHELPKDRYSTLKTKLIEDIRETLRTKKDLLSIVDLVNGGN